MKYESIPKDEFEDIEDIESQSDLLKSISPRIAFVRKVYGILLAQLTLTVAFTGLCMSSKLVKEIMLSDFGMAMLVVSAITTLVVGIAILCYTSVARTVPTNYIMLTIFTLAEAHMVGFICMMTNPKIVFMAAFMTLGMTFALTLYAFTTKRDFTIFGGALFIAGMALFMLGIFTMFSHNKFLNIVYSCLGVVLYGFYLIYDTQLIMGGKRMELDLDDYVIGALILYIDIIELFLHLLKLLNQDNK